MLAKNAKKTLVALLSYLLVAGADTQNTIDNSVIDEDIILLGDFNAISLYNSSNTYNLTSTNPLNVYEISPSNDTINLLGNSNLSSAPTLWQPIDDASSFMIIDNRPHVFYSQNLSIVEVKNWNNVDGDIETIYYDSSDQMLYIGGSCSFNDSHGAIQYDYLEEQLLSLPFGGFGKDSVVNSIVKDEISENILFAGSFSSVGYPELLNVTLNETHHNYTLLRNTSEIVDISQKIQFAASQVSATSGKNYENVICPTSENDGWSLSDGELGSWSAILENEVVPSKVRLYNSNSDSSGVKTFRVITYPGNGIMNMTYVDPSDLQVKYCDAFCPLSSLSNTLSSFSKSNVNITDNQYYTFTNNNQTVLELTSTFQDFAFVNSIDVSSFTIQVMEYYGDYSELLGIELYSRGITVYANNTLNSVDSCASSNSYDISVSSSPLGNITWESSSVGNYLYAEIPSSEIGSDQGMRFDIQIPVSGQYSVLMYTSGCLQDNSCDERGIVNVTVHDGTGKQLSTSLIYQTNEYEKYDTLYTGDLTLDADSVYVEMKILKALNSDQIYVVADSIQLQYIQLELNEITGNITTTYYVEKHEMIELNGLMEYSISNFTDDSILYPIGNTSFNLIGSALEEDAVVNQIILNDTSLVIGGNFESEFGDNILGLEIHNSHLSNQLNVTNYFTIDGGVNGEISQLYGPLDDFVMIGSFNKFTDMSHSALSSGSVIYNTGTQSIESLNISEASSVSQLSGMVFNNTEYLVINYNNSERAELLDYTSNTIFENSTSFGMNILSSLDTSDRNWMLSSHLDTTYVIGSIIQYDLESNNIVQVEGDNLVPVVLKNASSLVSGVYINNDTTIVAGDNIYQLTKNSTSLLSTDFYFDGDTQVGHLMYYKSDLIFSVNGSASFDSDPISGLAFYTLNTSSLKTLNETFNGSIADMSVDPEFGTIIAVGSFSVGDCESICTFGNNSDALNVNRSVSDISGPLSSLEYYDEHKVLIGGNFTANGKNGYLGIYDTYNNSVSVLEELSTQLSGPVVNFVFGNERSNNKTLDDLIVVMGTDYIGYFNNSKWTSISDGLDLSNGKLTDISFVKSLASSSNFYESQVLLLTGKFEISNYGIVSSALWNGKEWLPYTITAKNLEIADAKAQSVVRMTSMYIYDGTFTSSSTSTTVSSSTAAPSATSKVHHKSEFTNGEVAGVGCALAVGTLMLLAAACFLFYLLGDTSAEKLEGLKLTGEDRVYHGQKMMDTVQPTV